MDKSTFLSKTTRVERVTIEGVGELCLRPMPLRQRLQVEALAKGNDIADAMLVAVASTLCDDEGGAMFGSPEELEAIDPEVLEKIATEAMRVSGMTREAVEDAAKN